MSDLVTTEEAADLLRVPATVIRTWRHRRLIAPANMLRGIGRGGRVPQYRLTELQPLADAYHQRATRRAAREDRDSGPDRAT